MSEGTDHFVDIDLKPNVFILRRKFGRENGGVVRNDHVEAVQFAAPSMRFVNALGIYQNQLRVVIVVK